MEFRGKVGEVDQLRCQQFSLRPPEGPPQSQQVVIHYDSVDLAVLGVEVRLDDASVTLPEAINTRSADRAAAAQPRLQLETLSGQRFEVLVREVGTGSRQATREGFESLTPASQRDLLQAYLDKLEVQWSTPPERLSHLSATSLEWFGPQALPHLDEMLSDDRPVTGAAVLKYLCTAGVATNDPPQGNAFRSERYRHAMRSCIDRHRAGMATSIATMDRLLAQDLRDLEASDVRALNAFLDFRTHILYVFALGPDATESGPALTATVAGKDGLAPDLEVLIAAVLAPPDRLSPAAPQIAPRAPDVQLAREPSAQRPEHLAAFPNRTAEQLLAELDNANRRPRDEIKRDMVRLGDAATPALIAVLRDGTSPNMEFVVDVLCTRGPDAAGAIPDLRRIVEAPSGREPRSPWPTLYAVSALACVGRQSPEATRYLISLLKSPNAHLRAITASRLYQFQTTDVVLALGEALSDPDQAVRETALGSLMHMGPKASPAIPMLGARARPEGNVPRPGRRQCIACHRHARGSGGVARSRDRSLTRAPTGVEQRILAPPPSHDDRGIAPAAAGANSAGARACHHGNAPARSAGVPPVSCSRRRSTESLPSAETCNALAARPAGMSPPEG